MKRTTLTKNELSAVEEAAETVAARHDYIGKLDFLREVKNIVGEGKNHIKTALAVWNRHYAE